MMNKELRTVKIKEGIGSLLTETTRAYLYQGTPSAYVGRTLEGVFQFRQETEAANEVSADDRIVMAELEYKLRLLRDDLRQLEDRLYSCEKYDNDAR